VLPIADPNSATARASVVVGLAGCMLTRTHDGGIGISAEALWGAVAYALPQSRRRAQVRFRSTQWLTVRTAAGSFFQREFG
jgi:hypothetical protein